MKRALCIGINDYRWIGEESSLRGCINDAKEWAALLLDYYRFDEVDLMLDTSATPEAVKAALARMAASSKPGDVVAFTYSGHGTRVPDADGDEADGADEAIVLHGALLTDDELAEALAAFKPGVSVAVVSDSCHSGTMMRLMGGEASATGPRPRFLAPALFGKGTVVAGRPAHRFGKPRAATAAEAPRQVLLAGCKDYETSMDAYLANGYHGALSYHAVRILQEDPYLTWREVAARLRPRIACCSPQTPQAEGPSAALDAPVFM